MQFRALVLACGALIGGVHAANALCAVGDPNWPVHNVAMAQRLARFSNDANVSGAWVAGACTITALIHQGGAPCPTTQDTNHTTVVVHNIVGAYHVFTTQVGIGYCTTH